MNRRMKSRGRGARRTQHRRRLMLEGLEIRTLAAADLHLLQNPFNSEDVNDDGLVTPGDALMLINQMQLAGEATANPPQSPESETVESTGEQRYCDVNGDDSLSSNDLLRVVNRLNAESEESVSAGEAPRTAAIRPRPESPVRLNEVRSLDGTGNNVAHPDWGSAGTAMLRLTDAEYSDDVSAPGGIDRMNPRAISNLVSAQSESILNERHGSDMLWQWGQFIDHDLDLTLSATPSESLSIPIPAGDPYFDPANTGTKTMSFSRSKFDPTTGTSSENERQQVNSISAFMDGSQIYGSDATTAASLRIFQKGLLKTSEGGLLPTDQDGFYLAGDIRVNEQVGLIAIQALWVREHNRVAERVARQQPELNDEQIYQAARSIVIGELQAITYNEFLPALLGRQAIPEYRGYRPDVNPGISNLFATASYRFGHSMLSSEMLRLDNNGQEIAAGNIALRDAFFNPSEVSKYGIDSILKGLTVQEAQEIDTKLIDDVRNFLFGPPGSGGFDLASLNIQRGRDHGLSDYNQSRVEMGLKPVDSFDDISSDPSVQASLQAAYGDVNNIDAWVGGLAEDHQQGSSVGPLVQRVLADQFTRLRDGDRFWYQRTFSGPLLREIEQTRLSDVIRRNTTITNLQPNAFFAPTPKGTAGQPQSPLPTSPTGQTMTQPQNQNGLRQNAGTQQTTRPNTPPPPPTANNQTTQRSGNGGQTRSDTPRQALNVGGLSDSDFATNADQLFGRLGQR